MIAEALHQTTMVD
jgi:hypothetical protein